MGTGKYRWSNPGSPPRRSSNTDSGISGSDTDDSDKEEDDTAHIVGSEDITGGFTDPLPPDMVEVRSDGDSIEVELGANITDSNAIQEAYADVFCTHFGEHFAHKWLAEEGLAALVSTSPQGKSDDDGDDDPDSATVGPDVDKDKLIAQKTEFERLYPRIQEFVL